MNKHFSAAHELGLVMKFFWTHVLTVVNPMVYTPGILEEFHQLNTAQHVL